MFYNPKSLIHEKVLQQYYFESFLLCDPSVRKGLLPDIYWKYYLATNEIKGLHPEVNLGKTKKTKITLLILYYILQRAQIQN